MDKNSEGLIWIQLQESIAIRMFTEETAKLYNYPDPKDLTLIYKFVEKLLVKKRIIYKFRTPKSRFSVYSLWFHKNLYSKEELDLVDNLFDNLDEGNLAIIKGILHSKLKF